MFIRQERSIREFFHFYPVVSVIVITNIILWIFTQFLPNSIGEIILRFGIGQNFAISEFGEFWRLFTPIFLHANVGHVLFNSFALILFGPALERMVGKGRFILLYLVTGIVGNIGTYVINPYDRTLHLGASGAIYGLFGMYLYMTIRRQDLIDPQSAQIVRTIFIIGLVMTFIRPNINIAAHLFGFIGGAALAPLLLRYARPFYQPTYRRNLGEDEIGFDPDRWKKRRISPKVRRNLIWVIIGVIVILYIVSGN